TPELIAAQAAREAGNAPNAVLAAAASIVGPRRAEAARACVRVLVDAFAQAGLVDAADDAFDLRTVHLDPAARRLFVGEQPDARAQALLQALGARAVKSVFARFVAQLDGYPTRDAVLAAIATTVAWAPLMRKRISRLTAESLPWWIKLFGVMFGAAVPADKHEAKRFCGIDNDAILNTKSLTEMAFVALLGETPQASDLFAFQTLIGLLLTGNGPGAITLQGAKGAVSADGPETPERVQLNKALVGFLTHAGYAHGGNGYEGIAFLIEQFKDTGLTDPGDPNHGLDLRVLAV